MPNGYFFQLEGSTLIPPRQPTSAHRRTAQGEKNLRPLHKLGGCSAKAVAHVKKNGFTNVWNVAGGITAWSEQIEPTVPKYH